MKYKLRRELDPSSIHHRDARAADHRKRTDISNNIMMEGYLLRERTWENSKLL